MVTDLLANQNAWEFSELSGSESQTSTAEPASKTEGGLGTMQILNFTNHSKLSLLSGNKLSKVQGAVTGPGVHVRVQGISANDFMRTNVKFNAFRMPLLSKSIMVCNWA